MSDLISTHFLLPMWMYYTGDMLMMRRNPKGWIVGISPKIITAYDFRIHFVSCFLDGTTRIVATPIARWRHASSRSYFSAAVQYFLKEFTMAHTCNIYRLILHRHTNVHCSEALSGVRDLLTEGLLHIGPPECGLHVNYVCSNKEKETQRNKTARRCRCIYIF